MARGMSDEVSGVIVQALSRGLSRGQISGVVGLSKRSVTRISTNLTRYGSAKAPPSGAKMGRPAKMTNMQAETMLTWMAERNYTFYVKDLVAHLREACEYQGCEGTVRRCLVRAGFTRKLPCHKSQMTTWIPPDHVVGLQTVADERLSLTQECSETEQEALHQFGPINGPHIDPALETADSALHNSSELQSSTSHRDMARSRTTSRDHDSISLKPRHTITKPIQRSSTTTDAPSPPSLSSTPSSTKNPDPITPLPLPALPTHHPGRASRCRRTDQQHNEDNDKDNDDETNNDNEHDEIVPSPNLTTLGDEIARQQGLILHLQQQLASSSTLAISQGHEPLMPTADAQMLRQFAEAQDTPRDNRPYRATARETS